MTPVSYSVINGQWRGEIIVDAELDAGEAQQIAQRFVAARRAAIPLSEYPGTAPQTLKTAYDIQARAIAAQGGKIAGWKIGRILPPHDRTFGANRLAGPIFASALRRANDEPVMPVFVGGFAAVEAEYLFQLDGRIDPRIRQWSCEDALEHVSAVHIGFEIASSPFAGINQLGPPVTASDFGNNNGLVIGPPIPDWREAAYDGWSVTTTINAATVGDGRATSFPEGSAGSVRFALEFLAAQDITIARGTWVSSGAITGVHDVKPGDRVIARFDERLQIACSIGAATPSSSSIPSR
jgi:2-keto-4-pentenoate hydratase